MSLSLLVRLIFLDTSLVHLYFVLSVLIDVAVVHFFLLQILLEIFGKSAQLQEITQAMFEVTATPSGKGW